MTEACPSQHQLTSTTVLQVAGLGCVLGLFSLIGAAVFPIVLQREVFASLLCHIKIGGSMGH